MLVDGGRWMIWGEIDEVRVVVLKLWDFVVVVVKFVCGGNYFNLVLF